MLATFDLDFAHLMALARRAAPSVVLLRTSRVDTDWLGGLLQRLLGAHESDLTNTCILVVDDARVRVRSLPIS